MTMILRAGAENLVTATHSGTQTVISSPKQVNCQQMCQHQATTMRHARCYAVHHNVKRMIHSLLTPRQQTIARQHLRRCRHAVTALLRATATQWSGQSPACTQTSASMHT